MNRPVRSSVQRTSPPIAVFRCSMPAVEPAEQAALGVMVAGLDRLEQGRAERRRQGQCHQRREADRGDHRHRKLPVDDADRSGEERHRDEHRDQHQRDADDGAGDLAHRLARCFLRRQALLGHDALDVLDHDDRVIDQDADGEHHAEQRQHVDREAEHQKHRAGAEQRYRHHDGRNERVADVLQKQQHHQEDQHHRFHERRQHLLDRGLDHWRDVIGNVVFDVSRKELRQLVHLRLDGCRGCQRVAASARAGRTGPRSACRSAGW